MEMSVGKGKDRSLSSARELFAPRSRAAFALLCSLVSYFTLTRLFFGRLLELRVAKGAVSWHSNQCDQYAAANSAKQSNNLRGSRCSLGRSRMAGVPAAPKAGRIDDLPPGKRDGFITRYGQVPLRHASAPAFDADGARAGRRRWQHPAALHARRRKRHGF